LLQGTLMFVMATIKPPKNNPTSIRINTASVGDTVSLLHTIPSGVVDQMRTIKKYDTFTGTCQSLAFYNAIQRI
jgi:hypothetical protein